MASHRGGIVVFVSEVPFETENDQLVDVARVPADRFTQTYESVFDPTAVWRSFAGFKLARGKFSLGAQQNPTYHAIRVPQWTILTLTGLLTWMLLRAPLRRRRWRKQGRCQDCGYDLRESPQRCPECGKETTPAPAGESTARQLDPYVAAMLGVFVILEFAVCSQLWRAGTPPTETLYYTPEEVAAGLNRRIPHFDARGVTRRQAVAALEQVSGTHIETDWAYRNDSHDPMVL
jgi:hypothetical protein